MISNREVSPQIIKGIKVFFADVDGTLTDGCTYYSGNGEEMKKFNHKDGRGNYLLKQHNLRFGLITGEDTQIVEKRAEKLNADYCFLGIENKFGFLKEFCKQENLSFSELAYIGDDTNDLEIIKHVGISFAVNDAIDEVKKVANFVCQKNGGHGAFREAVDFLLATGKPPHGLGY